MGFTISLPRFARRRARFAQLGLASLGWGAHMPRVVPWYASSDTIPGEAAALYDGKTKTYSDQANFVPFIVESGGRINAAGLRFLSRILPLEAEGTAGLARRPGRAALRGISRALALQQGYMLAQIAEEIHAPDGGGGQQRLSGLGSSSR